MKSCTFFGHRDCPDCVKSKLKDVLSDLIYNHGVDIFYVGNQGRFDAIVLHVLRELKREFPHIYYAVVLAYIPGKQNRNTDNSDTMLPEGIETVHPRFAISWRNTWMLKHSDFVVTYIAHSWGGASKYGEMARKMSKKIINLFEMVESQPLLKKKSGWKEREKSTDFSLWLFL